MPSVCGPILTNSRCTTTSRHARERSAGFCWPPRSLFPKRAIKAGACSPRPGIISPGRTPEAERLLRQALEYWAEPKPPEYLEAVGLLGIVIENRLYKEPEKLRTELEPILEIPVKQYLGFPGRDLMAAGSWRSTAFCFREPAGRVTPNRSSREQRPFAFCQPKRSADQACPSPRRCPSLPETGLIRSAGAP